MELQPEWNEFLGLLMQHGVRFVLVGGLAVGVHGHERYTNDLDVLIDPSEANARRLGKALADGEIPAIGRPRGLADFAQPDVVASETPAGRSGGSNLTSQSGPGEAPPS